MARDYASFCGGRPAVVEDAHRVRVQRRDVMLEPEGGARPHPEAGPLPAKLPDDLPAGPGHLVDRAGVAGRQQQVAVGRDRDRVDVQVVERRGLGAPGERRVRVGDRDVVQAVPLEQDLAGSDVDLLHHAGQRDPLGRAADCGQVRGPRPVGGDQRGVLRADHELVQVRLQPVARLDGGDGAVRGVGDDRLALAVALDDLPFPPGEHGLAAGSHHRYPAALEHLPAAQAVTSHESHLRIARPPLFTS